ncbi:hypothetical protein CPB83DRAFT_860495 [Crepidotus variabilis]|uniref:Secreted protein n=1 Tax=Crepidotus variabilis TaxID=179855 RepID=A0A9P6E9H6_9AGAR|nr:hypothetical protein CPB83DRAFT_860495 [Crepidotus variabilis]
MFTTKYILIAFTLLSLVVAAPIGGRSIEYDQLEVREPQGKLLGAVQLAMKVRHLKPPPNGAVFWSGTKTDAKGKTVSVHADAKKLAKETGGKTIGQALKDQGLSIPNDKNSKQLWRIASKAYAKNAKGEVNAVLGSKVRPESVWNKVEKPTLEKNNNVNKVTEHNAQTGKQTVTKKK